MERQQPWLVSTKTHFPVQICADKTYNYTQAVNESHESMWMIEPTSVEGASLLVSSTPEGDLLASSSEFFSDSVGNSENTRQKSIPASSISHGA